MELDRRSFLKILTASIAVPIIARAVLQPRLAIPGVERVQAYAGEARYANAIFSPGTCWTFVDLLQSNIATKVPYGTDYSIIAVSLSGEEMDRESQGRYRRPCYASMWVTGDLPALKEFDRNYGRFRAGIVRPNPALYAYWEPFS